MEGSLVSPNIPLRRYTTHAQNCEMARPGGFEPPAFGTGIQRSIQLSYGREHSLRHR